jgi:hypothetical protein
MVIPPVALIPILIGLVGVAAAVLKVFKDRDMPLQEGIVLAVLVIAWTYLSVRDIIHWDPALRAATWVLAPIILVMLSRRIKAKVDREVPKYIAEQRRTRGL